MRTSGTSALSYRAGIRFRGLSSASDPLSRGRVSSPVKSLTRSYLHQQRNRVTLWRFYGITITQINEFPQIYAALNGDLVWTAVRGPAAVETWNTNDDTIGERILVNVTAMTGGISSFDGVWHGGSAINAGKVHVFGLNGYYECNQGTNANSFVPLLMSATSDGPRLLGWRSQIHYEDGGVVVATNIGDPTCLRLTNSQLSMLLWIGPNGNIRVLDAGGLFSGIAVFAGCLRRFRERPREKLHQSSGRWCHAE